MALGARAADVVRLVMRELFVVIFGVGIGLGMAVVATRFIESLMYGLSPTDPVTYVAATGVLLTVAALSAYLPARRASSVDPVTALRYD